MMSFLRIGFVVFSLVSLVSCQGTENEKYIIFLHNRFLEEHNLDDLHPEYGRVEYAEIIKEFESGGFNVISEQREGNVNAREYAVKVVAQVDSLLDSGVSPQSITVVGTSKGGYIAQYVSTLASNPDLNFVFVGSFQSSDIESMPEINYCGNILTIFEKSDVFGVSAMERKQQSTCKIENFKEVELNTGQRHGFLFKPMKEWMEPTIKWANGDYQSIHTIDNVYKSSKLAITKWSDNLYVHESYLRQYNNFPCNGMIYVNSGEAVVFDTPTDDSASVELIGWIEANLQCDIVGIVINHFHIDCLGGLDEFHKSGVPSFASDLTIKLASSEKAHNDVVPQTGFKDSLRIEVGDSYIENRYFGSGHSPDNIVSYIKDEKALFGGCLIKENGAGKGSLKDANTAEWSNTVQNIKNEYDGQLQFVVPGHGSPGGVELLDYTIKLFEQK